MKKFGLIGFPVSHSKSPLLFMAAYKNSILKDNLSYNLINEPDFNKALDIFLKGDYTGINITDPI
jgi:Shikimate 5-dehydrogenase